MRECNVYNSCTDRHCPLCGGARRATWLDKTSTLLLPGVNYFQVVFTLPDKLSPLILGNRKDLYDLLFRSAWRALDETLRDGGPIPAGGRDGAAHMKPTAGLPSAHPRHRPRWRSRSGWRRVGRGSASDRTQPPETVPDRQHRTGACLSQEVRQRSSSTGACGQIETGGRMGQAPRSGGTRSLAR